MIKESEQKLYLLNIEHRHGNDNWICDSRKTAVKVCADYVREWWEQEVKTDEDFTLSPPMPEDEEQLIDEYFTVMGEKEDHGEWYSILELPIITYEEES